MEKVSIFWFRRDLRLDDNTGLYYAYTQEKNILPLFIFDRNILDKLEDKRDARVEFIHSQILSLSEELKPFGSSILVKYGKPTDIWKTLIEEYDVQSVYTNRDYEPYAKERDDEVKNILKQKSIQLLDFKDQVIFEKDEIVNGSGEYYKVFTPYSRNWMEKFKNSTIQTLSLDKKNRKQFFQTLPLPIPSLEDIGFKKSHIKIPVLQIDRPLIQKYDQNRNFPAIKGTSRLGVHLRFGTISIRKTCLGSHAIK
jgi:deoxyribodipyrimidine photo-lyase